MAHSVYSLISVHPETPRIPSPLTGEGKGGGEKLKVHSDTYQFPLPFIPSRQGRGRVFLDEHLLSTQQSIQIPLLPRLQSVVIAIPCFQLAEPFGVGYFAAIAMLNSKVIV